VRNQKERGMVINMQINTVRFGPIEIDESKLIIFDEGIPGLDEYKRYALLQFEESYPIIWLQSVDEGAICLPVLDTFVVIKDYVFDIEDADVKALELKGPEDLHIVSVLVIPEEIKGMTANLAAPIIINTVIGKAKQIVLSGSNYNVRTPIFAEIAKLAGGEEGDADASTV
jgi:flagellar assembly factor FliW